EVDAGLHTQLATHVHEVLGRDVARRILEARVRATTEPRYGGLEVVEAHLHRRERIRETESARIVQMQVDALSRPAILHHADHPANRQWIRPAHRVGELDQLD